MSRGAAWTAAALGLALASCGDGEPARATGGSAGGAEFRLEAACNVEGLKPSLRHTYVLIDESALARSDTPQDFVAENAAVRDAVLAFADPERATASGVSDYRERVSIFLLPASGSGAKRLFTGCLPGLSPDEMAQARSGESAVGSFFTGGKSQAIAEQVEAFRTRVISALVQAAGAANEAARPTGRLGETSLLRSLRASGRLIASEEAAPRIVLLSDLSGVDTGTETEREAVRRAGFKQGVESGLDFGRADLIVISPGGKDAVREFADAFFLSQHADLTYLGDNPTASATAAPTSIRRYTGEAAYPAGPEAVQIRVATDRNGRLVNSWLILRGQPDRSTPLTGQAVCEAGGVCEIRSDDGGFAQAWTLSPGGEPEFVNDMPFGGLRSWSLSAGPEKLTGKVYDPVVALVGASGEFIPIKASAQPSATF